MKKITTGLLALAIVYCSFSISANENPFYDARWIGSGATDLPFHPDCLPVFRIDFDIDIHPGGKGTIVYGLDDPRLMNANLNIFNLENPKGSSYIKVEFNGDGNVDVFRAGYCPSDNARKPLATFKTDFIKGLNHITVTNNLGHFNLLVNGKTVGKAGLNPNGNGGDYLAFPVLARMAFDIPEDGGAAFSNVQIRNFREPANVICAIPGVFNKTSAVEWPEKSMPELKTVLTVPDGKEIGRASITCTARGIYDLYVNGKRVTDDYFNPGSTQYNRTHQYHNFSLTGLLHPGDNEITGVLGEGWWSGGATFVGENWNFYGDRQSFIARIDVAYSDGTTQRFVTSPENWQYSADGPLVEASFFQGEIYDASRESGREWKPAVEISTDSTVSMSVGDWSDIEFIPSFGDRVIAVDTVQAVAMTEPRPGVYVYDMGQNLAGVPLITFEALKPHQEVRLRYAEMVYPDMPRYSANKGMIMTENLRAAMCCDIFKADSMSFATFSPRFTLHGYRYLELIGVDRPLPLENVKSLVLSSIHDFKAHYECSDSLVNRLWENIKWSSRSNFISIPTDCPQRNERLGWMGDISVFASTATKIADVSALLRQYLRSVRDCQGADGRFPDVAPTGFGFGGLLWGSAGITVPWECYRQYGDICLLREHYPAMKRYISYILSKTMDPATGIIVQKRAWGDLADWLSPEYDKTDKSLLWECYFIYDLEIMANVARLVGYRDDAAVYDNLRDERIRLFADTYVDKATCKTVWSDFDPTKKGQAVDTQASYALPIALGIYDDAKFVDNFLNTVKRENIADDGTVCPPYSLMTGFIGTAWIMDALSKTGNTGMAYRLLTTQSYPSWLYPVTQGATTVWERLNSYTHKDGFGKNNSMNSFNHYSFGAVGNWLLTRSLGIMEKEDGSIWICPEIDTSGSLTYAKGWLDTRVGRVSSGWRIEGNKAVVETELPSGTAAILVVDGKTYRLKPGKNRVAIQI